MAEALGMVGRASWVPAGMLYGPSFILKAEGPSPGGLMGKVGLGEGP